MISIDWGTKVITVPKTYTTLIATSPFELRELDINQFRLDLKSLEADAIGIPHLITHVHNTEVVLAGVTLARVVAIINGYTITFENGNYGVNLIGANSNVADVTNLNTVQIRSFNSAGLISVDQTQNVTDIATAVWAQITSGQDPNTFGQLLLDLLLKSDDVQHTLNVHNEMLKNNSK